VDRREAIVSSRLLALALIVTAAIVPAVTAAPVAVRLTEADARGFLIVRDTGSGKVVAKGEFIQVARGDTLESRLTFRFVDGSLSDETVVFSQRSVFRLLSYRLIQRGSSFPESLEVSVTRDPPFYSARTRSREGKEASRQGALDVPAELANGMLGLFLRNLPPGRSESVQIVAFTPEPRFLDVLLGPATEVPVLTGGIQRPANLFVLKPKLRGIARLVAPLIGKEPPTLRYWILGGDVPAFLRFEGPMFMNGPPWRVDLTGPGWPGEAAAHAP